MPEAQSAEASHGCQVLLQEDQNKSESSRKDWRPTSTSQETPAHFQYRGNSHLNGHETIRTNLDDTNIWSLT